GYHKPASIFKNDIVIPIHLGRSLYQYDQINKDGNISKQEQKWLLDNMIGDDIGENISTLNRYFCELTGIYWAWKNYEKLNNPEYIGFMHYRRFFNFDLTVLNEYDNLSYLINEEKILDIIMQNQRIFLEHHKCNPVEQYKNISFHKIEDYDKALAIINSSFSQFSEASIKYNKGNCCYFCNMFILPKQDFIEYCEFVFGVLFELKSQIDLSNRNIQEARVFGYIAERLTGIYFTELKLRKVRYKELPMRYFGYKVKKKQLTSFYNNSIKLCFSVDNFYILYLYITIVSIIKHSTLDEKYEIFLLYNNLDIHKMNYFYELQRDNIFIKFVKIDEYVDKIDYNFFVDRHATITAYYRLFIPEIFSNFDKILYLDCDLVACDDVKKIYNTDMQNYIIAATKDPCLISDLNTNSGFMNYCVKELELENPLNYFQSGVMLFNIKKCIQFNLFNKCIKKIEKIKKPVFWDQDILNSVLQDNVKFLKLECNVEWTFFEYKERLKESLPLEMYEEYNHAYINPTILHY
ncbi:DUF4422 domain-containing protein, partial [Campylobacter volucris]|uniref:DUF4422 domain-containing protein n=1 Tax=Campylobacter volucris TaxID=1031542 RepID=UPI00189D9336